MRAAWYTGYGSPDHITVGDLPTPEGGRDDVRVRVRATSVNPVDWKIASGKFPFNIVRPGLPYVPGFDIAGEVERAAGGFREGDRVYARIPGTQGGAAADHVDFAPYAAALVPDGMDFAHAAGVPLAGLTALQGLRDHARLPLEKADGWRVLVIGASGGVGHFGVQIAKAAGAHVTGVCSGRNEALVRELGADEVIDYTKSDTWNGGGNFDVILDCVGGVTPSRFTPWLTARGVYASTLPDGRVFAQQLGYAVIFQRKVRGVMLKTNGDDLRVLGGLVSSGALRTHIDETFPLEKMAAAHRASMTGRTRGKLVVTIA